MQQSAPLSEVFRRDRLPLLDGIRALSVVLVVVGHHGWTLPADLGVAAFFVLSGMLITWLLHREFTSTGDVSLGQFYFRRTLRIFPAYYAFVTSSVILDRLLGDKWSPALLASAYGYAVNYYNAFTGHPTTTVAHAWSLAIEEQFYLIWPLAFLLLMRRSRRAVVIGLCASAIAVCGWRAYLLLGRGVSTAYVYNAFDTRFDTLAIGCLLALLLVADRADRIARLLAPRPWAALVTLGLLALSRYGTSEAYHHAWGYTVNALLIAAFFVQVLAWQRAAMWRWLDWRWIRHVGILSYPIYLYHGWAANLSAKIPGLPSAAHLLVTCAIVLVVAQLSHTFVERPFLSLRRLRQGDRPEPTTPAAVAIPAGAATVAVGVGLVAAPAVPMAALSREG